MHNLQIAATENTDVIYTFLVTFSLIYVHIYLFIFVQAWSYSCSQGPS